MRSIINVGDRFTRLVAIEFAGIATRRHHVWKCICDCGTIRYVHTSALRSGDTKSCGCYQRERASRGADAFYLQPEYNVWSHMKSRCKNPRDKAYGYYGARGISVCAEWDNSFEAFMRDMGRRPSPLHTLERKDNDGGYGKDNCAWTTMAVQNRNTRKNNNFTINGTTRCLTDWIHISGVSYGKAYYRIKIKGEPIETVLGLGGK